MRLISQHGHLDGSTGRDNRQIHCPLRASEQYKAVYVPGNPGFDLRRMRAPKTGRTIRVLHLFVGGSLHNHQAPITRCDHSDKGPRRRVTERRLAIACNAFRILQPSGKNFATEEQTVPQRLAAARRARH
jgi:hypothetical protein